MVDMQRFREDLRARFGVAQVVTAEGEMVEHMNLIPPRTTGVPAATSMPTGFQAWPQPDHEQETVDAIREAFLLFARRYQCVPTLANLVLTPRHHVWQEPVLVGSEFYSNIEVHEDAHSILAVTEPESTNVHLCLQTIDFVCNPSREDPLTPEQEPPLTSHQRLLVRQRRFARYRNYRYRNDTRGGLDAPRGALGYRALLKRTVLHELHHFFYSSDISDPMHVAFRRHAGWIGPHYIAGSNLAPDPAARKYDVGQAAVRAFVDSIPAADLEAPAPAALDAHRFRQLHTIWDPGTAGDPGQPWSDTRVEQPISDYCLDAPDEDFCEIGAAYCWDPGRLRLRAPRAYAFAREWLRPTLMRAHPAALPVATGWVRTAVAP